MVINNQENEIMTVKEVADYLKVSEKSILRMAQKGEIPVTKVASQWRFMRHIIDEWLISQMNFPLNTGGEAGSSPEGEQFTLSSLLEPELVIFDLPQGDKKQVLDQMLVPLVNRGYIRDSSLMLKLLLEREALVSTAIGNGAAIPHVRVPSSCPVKKDLIVIGINREGVNFDSIDGRPTNLFFLTCSTSDITHLKILARLGVLIRDGESVKALLKAEDFDGVLRAVGSADDEVRAE